MTVLVSMRRAFMRGHECIVENIVFDCANSPMIFQMFTQPKFIVGFHIGTKGHVQETSKVKCQLMSSLATIFLYIP